MPQVKENFFCSTALIKQCLGKIDLAHGPQEWGEFDRQYKTHRILIYFFNLQRFAVNGQNILRRRRDIRIINQIIKSKYHIIRAEAYPIKPRDIFP